MLKKNNHKTVKKLNVNLKIKSIRDINSFVLFSLKFYIFCTNRTRLVLNNHLRQWTILPPDNNLNMRFENNYYSVTKEANQISRIGMIGRGDIPPQRIETRQRYLFRSEIRSEGKYRCSQGMEIRFLFHGIRTHIYRHVLKSYGTFKWASEGMRTKVYPF